MTERGETTPPGPRSRQRQPDEPIEIRRSLDALRRAWKVIALVVIVTTAAVVAVSVYLPNTYKATATIVFATPTTPFASTDVGTRERELETFQRLLGTREVLQSAADKIPGETADSLDSKVSSSVDQNADIIGVSAFAKSSRGAAVIANAVAHAFKDRQTRSERAQLVAAAASLATHPLLARARGASVQELNAINATLADLSIQVASAGSDLEVVPAEPPDAPYSPRPVRNGVLAFFAALFLGIVAVLARDRLVPRVGNPREVSRVLWLPPLVWVPFFPPP